MTKYINKLESWGGWSQYLTPKAYDSTRSLKIDKVAFGFIDQVVANHIKHKNPLSYNSESDCSSIPDDLLCYLSDLQQKHKVEFTAKFEYTYYDNPEKAHVEGDWGGINSDTMEITLHDLTKCKSPIGKEFLANGYTVMLVVHVEDLGPHQYIIG